VVISQDPSFKNPDNTLRDYSGVRNQCLDAARHEWFLYIDSDETATAELVESVRHIIQDPKHLVYNVSPRIILDGKLIEHSSNYPGWQKRFFSKKSGARFRKAIHERITYNEAAYPAGYLRGHWHYYISRSNNPRKLKKYIRLDFELHRTKKFGVLLSFVTKKAETVVKTAIKTLLNSLLHPRTSMPLRLEWSRIYYQLALTGLVIFAYFKKEV